jgi:hypothetical protein
MRLCIFTFGDEKDRKVINDSESQQKDCTFETPGWQCSVLLNMDTAMAMRT